MRFDLSLSQEQKQTLSAVQIQSLQLLAMDNFELRQAIQAEYMENPMLEYERHTSGPSIQRGYVAEGANQKELPTKDSSLGKLIISQLNIRKYSKKQWSVIKFLIDNLDDRGFFQADPKEMAAMNGVSEETVLSLLQDLKQLEPRGLFARDMQECLLLQLEDQEQSDSLTRQLIEHHLEALSRGEIQTVAKKLSVPTASIRRALDRISQLNPLPLNGLDTSGTDYVIPDILLEPDPTTGKLLASLNDDWVADYRLSDYYVRMSRSTEDAVLQEYFRKKYQRAKLLIESIEQRRQTLLAIGNYLGQVQKRFLLGKGKKVPITMTATAENLQLSISTVSRAVKGKYIQYPAGCSALKDLFETSVGNSDVGEYSRDAIKEALKALIAGEDKTVPLSDAALAEKLRGMNISISRRTVAKYRESMCIPGCFDRRKY